MSKRGQNHAGEIDKQLTRACGSSQTLDRQLGSLHGTELGSLYVGDSCEVDLFEGPLPVGPGSIPGT